MPFCVDSSTDPLELSHHAPQPRCKGLPLCF